MGPVLPVVRGLDGYSHSRCKTYRTCAYKHYLHYNRGLRPRREADYYRLGGIIHWALDELARGVSVELIWEGIAANYSVVPPWCNTPEMERDWSMECEVARRLFWGYTWQWGADTARVVASELQFRIPILNPDTGRFARDKYHVGKIDKLIEMNGRLGVREHKTAGESIDPNAKYWAILKRDAQISLYVIAARALGYDIQFVEYDAIRKPALSPYSATPAESRKFTKDGRLYASQRAEDETVDEFGSRLWADIQERPGYYYQRCEITRLDQDLISARRDLWNTMQMIRVSERDGFWPRNPDRATCTFCEFDTICDNEPGDSVPDGFRRVDWAHSELSENKNGTGTAAPLQDPAPAPAGAPAADDDGGLGWSEV